MCDVGYYWTSPTPMPREGPLITYEDILSDDWAQL